MRRAIWFLVGLGLFGVFDGARADEPSAELVEPATAAPAAPAVPTITPFEAVAAPMPCGGPYDWSPGYGRKLRGGYGINGYAPWFGPVWGPEAFIYANGLAMDPRPLGSYVRYPVPCDALGAPIEELPPGVAVPVERNSTHARSRSYRR